MTATLGVCVLSEPAKNAPRVVRHANYIHEILGHVGLCYQRLELEELPATFQDGLQVLLTIGEYALPDAIKAPLTAWIVKQRRLLADYTRDCKIVNNTIYVPMNRLDRLIRLVHDNDGLLVANSLLCSPPIRNESQSKITFSHNLEKDVSRFLLAPLEGNLRLRAGAVEATDKARVLPQVTQDIDRRARDTTPDIGAHEFNH